MKFTKEMILATEVVRRVHSTPVSSKQLATVLGTSEYFLQRIVGKLRKAHLVKVKKGLGGGVFKNPFVRNCSVLDIYRALDQKPEVVQTEGFFSGVYTDIFNLLGSTMVPIDGLETEDVQAREGA